MIDLHHDLTEVLHCLFCVQHPQAEKTKKCTKLKYSPTQLINLSAKKKCRISVKPRNQIIG